jgi:hypothetical protein
VEKSCLVAIKFVTKVQLKGLTHMFCILMSSYKVYKKGAFSLDYILKSCGIWDELKEA